MNAIISFGIFALITILIALDNFYFHVLENVFGIPHKPW